MAFYFILFLYGRMNKNDHSGTFFLQCSPYGLKTCDNVITWDITEAVASGGKHSSWRKNVIIKILKIILPPLQIKLGMMKQFVQAREMERVLAIFVEISCAEHV